MTEHYRVVRDGDIVFEKVPVDGSSKMPDELMDAIEPFNYEAMSSFSDILRSVLPASKKSRRPLQLIRDAEVVSLFSGLGFPRGRTSFPLSQYHKTGWLRNGLRSIRFHSEVEIRRIIFGAVRHIPAQ